MALKINKTFNLGRKIDTEYARIVRIGRASVEDNYVDVVLGFYADKAERYSGAQPIIDNARGIRVKTVVNAINSPDGILAECYRGLKMDDRNFEQTEDFLEDGQVALPFPQEFLDKKAEEKARKEEFEAKQKSKAESEESPLSDVGEAV